MHSHYKESDKRSTAIVHRSQSTRKPRELYRGESISRCIGNSLNSQNHQAKLSIGSANDKYEREADDVADRFVENQSNVVSVTPADNNSVTNQHEQYVQRACAECEEEKFSLLQRKPNGQPAPIASSQAAGQINAATKSGKPLSSKIRHQYEKYFRADFSHVRIHTGSTAIKASDSINARAFTLGNHIVFGRDQFRPTEKGGRHILAHELTHVVQQSKMISPRHIQRQAAGDGASATPAPINGGLTDEMLKQISRRLRAAMSGPGTDEEALFSSLSGRNQEQVNAIERVYNQMYARSLRNDLTNELTESELLHMGIFSPTAVSGTETERSRGYADLVAHQLNRAMDRIGTDEESIYAALTGRAPSERLAIKQAYTRLTRRELEHDLREELSGSELVRAIRLLNQGVLREEDELFLSMEGLGTDEDLLFRVLDSIAGNSAKILQVAAAYRRKYGDLIAHLRSDLNSEEYARAMTVLRADLQDVDFEDCATGVLPQIRALIPVGIRKVEHAIQVLSGGWTSMATNQQTEFNRFFDPSGAGIDSHFLSDVLNNFRAIRREFDDDLTVECESSGGLCGTNLYYTYWSNIHVCPGFSTSTDSTQKARDFVHELAHNAMLAVDRPYYSPSSAEYQALTPRGIWSNQLPVIGALSRVISRSDTLYHPDAYSWFAFTVP